ncbi:signal transduction histidine kinase [Scopulibacillus daqui]|uniref:histidine kinase n=1 Tax=Scopulibacillus daqui TaxID=1469162 RepID=A0ABS2PX85_9BACL|nr:GAF domain-containing protein [Scopulibacillus daqui]MBM7643912.1 signal transduction histidine kinase [Scopulibacillus daqui]
MKSFVDEVNLLKVIAETLNRSNDMKQMLQHVLEKLLEITGLSTGWIFIAGEEPDYQFVAGENLPQALSKDHYKPMCSGKCFCLSQYWDQKLTQAVNIINCKRIEDAEKSHAGDTGGITHHATVPILAGGEHFGILNVTAPFRDTFDQYELNLLQSVAYQIGTAIKKMKLFEAEQKRAEDYAKLDEASRAIWESANIDELYKRTVSHAVKIFGFRQCALLIEKNSRMELAAYYDNGKQKDKPGFSVKSSLFADIKTLGVYKAKVENDDHFPIQNPSYYVPILAGSALYGYLALDKDIDVTPEVLKAFAEHIGLAIGNFRLQEKNQHIQIIEERNRLARDLHDAVSQKLFSLSLTAKGALKIKDSHEEMLAEALDDIRTLAKEAMGEMKAMIWQLRPHGLENGLLSAAETYGEALGLRLTVTSEHLGQLPAAVKETVWRVLQEALNNISKHSQSDQAEIVIKAQESDLFVRVADHGIGFDLNEKLRKNSTLGLKTMRERIEGLNGEFNIEARPGEGAVITFQIPLQMIE